MRRAPELNALAPMLRALARLIGKPLGRRLSVIWGALAIGAVVLERAIDPHRLRRVIPTHEPYESALYWSIAALVWLLLIRRAVAASFFDRERLAWAWRMPISPLAWGVFLTPWLLLAVSLPALSTILWNDHIVTARALTMGALLAPASLALSHGSRAGYARALALFSLLALALAIGQRWPWAWWIAASVSAPGGLLAVGVIYLKLAGQDTSRRGLGPRRLVSWPFGALLHRDLLCLCRLHPGILLGWAITTALVAAFTFALGRHGTDPAITVWALGALLSFWTLPIIQRLDESLGARFTLHLYPVTSALRARSLAALACAPLLASTILSLLVGGWTSIQNVLVTIALALALATGHLAMVLFSRWRESAPIWMWFGALALFFIAYASPWWGALLIELLFAVWMVYSSTRSIERRRMEATS